MTSTGLNKSYPSAPVTFADVPEIVGFDAKFVYNYFTPDESITDKGVEFDTTGDNIERKLERRVPRYVQFNFKPPTLASNGRSPNEFKGYSLDDDIVSDIRSNIGKIKFEHDIGGVAFTSARFQDNNIDDKLYIMASGTISRRVKMHNDNLGKQFNTTQGQLTNILARPNVNLFDAARLLSTGMGSAEANLIIKSLNKLSAINSRFINDDLQREQQLTTFERVKEVGVDVQVNSKFVNSVLRSIVSDPFCLFADEVKPTLSAASIEQSNALLQFDPGSIDAAEYETFADPVRTRNIDVSSFDSRRRIIGFIIDKSEVQLDGKIIQREPIIIQGGNASKAYDIDIAYGRKYIYAVRAIYEIELAAVVEDHDEVVAATILLSSKPSSRKVINTIEHVPPPPPADFNVDWDRTNKAARITWSFPVNSQRDIKRWQVFRRSSIYEPFELLIEYNFDDSIVRTPSGETVNQTLSKSVSSPINYYIDYDFGRASKYIYSVCAIDAHGISSNYSVQFEAWFDAAKNDIKKRLISGSGAPKPYPNMFITSDDVFVDTIRDSGHARVEIIFDPEFLEVTDAMRNKLNLISTDATGGVYRLQLINTDLQQDAILDIIVKDRRKPVQSKGNAVRRIGARATMMTAGRRATKLDG